MYSTAALRVSSSGGGCILWGVGAARLSDMGDSVVMLVHRLYPTPPRTEYGHERPNLFCPFRPLRFLQLHFWSVSLLQTKSAAHRSLANREAAFGGRKSPGDHLRSEEHTSELQS